MADRSTPAPRAALDAGLPDETADADRVARLALEEDGAADVTSEAAVASGAAGAAAIEFRSSGVLAGTGYADAVARCCGLPPVRWQARDGERAPAGAVVGTLEGALAAILRAERPLLNLLQRACGIATATRAFVDAVAGTPCRILHTRKTAPGLRGLDIRAVLAGGGSLNRTSLARVVMVKDAHWRALARQGGGTSLAAVLDAARARGVTTCVVEVESLEQVEAACAARAERILVDNQSPETVRRWAEAARRLAPRGGIEIEASGGITLATVRAYADAGADFVSVGALTHSVQAADLALELDVTRSPSATG
ncbi:MAG: carboxylating nicotinate-nucleotide diphosphorylase [Gemmatimonadetes bacterium]|nr:carboxylating nicotinate-nucleotide diphosphorylase [Gemmatimonadota bacterium]